MSKELLKNIWFLAFLLLIFNLVLAGIMYLVFYIFGVQMPSVMGSIAALIGATVLGQIYAHMFKEIMPKNIRIGTTIIFAVIQLIIATLFLWANDIFSMEWSLLLFLCVIGVIVLVIHSFIVYFCLSSPGEFALSRQLAMQNQGLKSSSVNVKNTKKNKSKK